MKHIEKWENQILILIHKADVHTLELTKPFWEYFNIFYVQL